MIVSLPVLDAFRIAAEQVLMSFSAKSNDPQWYPYILMWSKLKRRRGEMVLTTIQLHSTMLPLRFSAGLDHAPGMKEVSNEENPREWSRLELRLHVFCR